MAYGCGRVQVVQVTDTRRDAIEVRLLMSAKDSPTLFDLRCDIEHGLSDKAGGAGKRNGHIRTM